MSNDYHGINAQVSLSKIYHLFVVASYLLWSQVTKINNIYAYKCRHIKLHSRIEISMYLL